MLTIVKTFNNNVVLATQNEQEVVVIGKGVGYQKKPGDILKKQKSDQLYVSSQNNWVEHFSNLFSEIEPKYFDLASKIIAQAQEHLQTTFNSYLLISLTDHLHFAVYRFQQQMNLQNNLLWQIKQLYPTEFAEGLQAVAQLNQTFAVDLGEDEAGFIAMKFVENNLNLAQSQNFSKETKIIEGILNIIKYHFHLTLDYNALETQRLITHLRFFVARHLEAEPPVAADDLLWETLQQQYPEIEAVIVKIVKFLRKNFHIEIASNEKAYLLLHISRLLVRNQMQN